jgi:hypothetical protein
MKIPQKNEETSNETKITKSNTWETRRRKLKTFGYTGLI